MPVRERGKFYMDNPQIGSAGTQFTKMLCGTASINAPSMLGHGGTASGTASVPGASGGECVFVMASASLETGVVIINASAVSGCITASFVNSGCGASASSDVTVSYLIVATA